MSEKTCEWCHVAIRCESVLVGPSPGRPVDLWIDREPHPDGRVIQRRDGQWRMLARYARGDRVVVPAYRVHSARHCAHESPGQGRAPAVRDTA